MRLYSNDGEPKLRMIVTMNFTNFVTTNCTNFTNETKSVDNAFVFQ